MSARATYGKSAKRYGAKLQSAVEFSPTKRNNLGSLATVSSDSLESDDVPLTSPLSSPSKGSNNVTINKPVKDDFDFGVFDLTEEEAKPEPVKKVNRARVKISTKKDIQPRASKVSKVSKAVPKSPASNLNSFFVESSVKPSWSPSRFRSATNSPNPEEEINQGEKTPTSSFLECLSKPSSKKSPKRQLKLQSSNLAEEWNFLSDLTEEGPKKKTMKMEIQDVEEEDGESEAQRPSKSSPDNGLIEYLNSQQSEFNSDIDSPTKSHGAVQSFNSKTSSTSIAKSTKGYGAQRSFLMEKPSDEADTQADDSIDHDVTFTSETGQENNSTIQGLNTISSLRAQGENAQYADELSFIVEGIESKSKSSSLLELAIRLFDESFAQFIKHHGLPNLQKLIDLDKELHVFVLGFIICKVTESGNGNLEFDQNLVNVVVELLTSKDTVDLKKESKMTGTIFEDFRKKLDEDYKPSFFGLSMLLQNGPFINDELLPPVMNLFKRLTEEKKKDDKMINMALILLERYLSQKDAINRDFEQIMPQLLEINKEVKNCKVTTLKLLIVLSVKNFKAVFIEDLLEQSINSLVKNFNNPTGLLELGLLINLVEDESCCTRAISKPNMNKLLKLQKKLEGEHKHYFALLIGIIISKRHDELSDILGQYEIQEVSDNLEEFDSKGKQLVNLQVEDINSKLHDILNNI